MTISFAPASASAESLVSRHVTDHLDFAAKGDPKFTLARPHWVFNLGLSDIVEHGSLSRATMTGLRYLVQDSSGQPVSSAEVRVAFDGKVQGFAELNVGPFVAETRRGIEFAERAAIPREVSYEFRLLRIPALYVMATWLHDRASASTDFVVPMAPAPSFLESHHVYDSEAFVSLVRQPAAAQAAAYKRLDEHRQDRHQ